MHAPRDAERVLSFGQEGSNGPVAILAGSGRLPILIADRLAAQGRDHRIMAIRGFADRELRRRAHEAVGLLDVRRAMACLDSWVPACVVLAGGLQRPDAGAVIEAFGALRSREHLADLLSRGDDNLLRGVLDLLEERGHRLVGVHEFAPELLARSGTYGSVEPDASERRSAALGLSLLRELSPFDIGQAAVVLGKRILAVEGPEGTDGMLARVGARRRPWPFRRGAGGGVLVKAAKLGQDRRVDLPAIGPRTVRNAARAGLAGIAVASGSTLVLDAEEATALADRLGIFLVGLPENGGVGP